MTKDPKGQRIARCRAAAGRAQISGHGIAYSLIIGAIAELYHVGRALCHLGPLESNLLPSHSALMQSMDRQDVGVCERVREQATS